jgi:hypothetical protein
MIPEGSFLLTLVKCAFVASYVVCHLMLYLGILIEDSEIKSFFTVLVVIADVIVIYLAIVLGLNDP